MLVVGSPLARPLLEEVTSQVAHKGAYALVRQSILASRVWIREAPLELVRQGAPLDLRTLEEIDAMIVIDAPENTRDSSHGASLLAAGPPLGKRARAYTCEGVP